MWWVPIPSRRIVKGRSGAVQLESRRFLVSQKRFAPVVIIIFVAFYAAMRV